MFRPHHPASIEFWLSLSFFLNFYNFLVGYGYINPKLMVLSPSNMSLVLMLITMGLVVSIYKGAKEKVEKTQDSETKSPNT